MSCEYSIGSVHLYSDLKAVAAGKVHFRSDIHVKALLKQWVLRVLLRFRLLLCWLDILFVLTESTEHCTQTNVMNTLLR